MGLWILKLITLRLVTGDSGNHNLINSGNTLHDLLHTLHENKTKSGK